MPTYYSSPCRRCEKKICYENCADKEQWLRNKAQGGFLIPNNMRYSNKEAIYRGGL